MKVIAKLFSFLLIQSFILFFSCTEKPSGPNISDELKPHGSITGYIYSLLDNQPVKDVLVSVNADSARAGISDATGNFTVGKVTAGTYTLRFIHRDYDDNPSYTVTVEQGVDDTLSDTVWLSYAYYTLKGNVVYNTTQLPGAGVAVSGTPYSTLTDLNGSFLLTMIPCRLNAIKLICAKTGFGYGVDSSITCVLNDTTDVGSIYLISGGATVYGTVYDTSGNPISEVYVVAAIGGGLTDTTDMSGSYKLKNVPCNEKVTIYIPPTDKFYGSSVGFLLKEGTEAQIDIYLRPISDTTNISKVSLYTDDMIVNESDITANLTVFPETGVNTVIDTYCWNIGATTPKKQFITYDPECLVLVDTLKKYAGYFKGQKLETAVEVFAKTSDGYTSNSSYFTVMIHTNQPVVTAGASLHKDSTAKDAVTVEKNRGVWFKAKATDPFGGIDSITWNFGDGCTKVFSDTFPNFAYFYNSIDTFHAVVRAFDTDGNTASDTVIVRVTPPQITAPELISPADLDTVFIDPGDSIPLTWHKKQEPNLTYTAYMEYKSTYPTEIVGTALQDTVLKVPVTIGRTYYWRVEAVAATSDASSAVRCFTVAQKQVNNNAPQFDTSYTMRDSVEGGKIYTDTLRARDIDNDPMNFSLLNAPAAMTLNNTVITWQTDTVDTGNYTVTARVRDSKGGADTLTWNITVTPPVSPPVITLDPQPQTVSEGQTATFGVVASGTRPFTWQWQKAIIDTSGDTSFASINGENDSAYTTPATSLADNGTLYRCVVSNSVGFVRSKPALLTVNDIVPTITGDPQPQAIAVGQTATFGVIATGTKPLSYQWFKNVTLISGAVDSSYTTPVAAMPDSGTFYTCIVSNSAGSDTSAAAMLHVSITVVAPTITGDPQSIAVNEGQTATFGVIASGTKPFTYQWQKDSVTISGANDSSYTTPAASMSDNGSNFRCIVSNGGGSDTSNEATLTVNAIPPTITGDPQSIAVNEGQTAIFGVIATGTKPFTYQWQKDSVNISGATDSSYTTPAASMGDNGAKFRCIVNNSGGSATSAEATLTVNAIPPTITGNPQSTAVNEGQTATFGVIATGTKPFTHQWQKDSVDISGATDSSYTTPATTMGDNGAKFRCVVTNSGGSATSAEATLTVNAIPPTVTGDPQPQTVNVGQTATFGVIATGTQPFTYKWQKGGVGIAGATDSSYTTPAATNGDNNTQFRCIVSNSAGADTSQTALLTVTNQSPQFTSTPVSMTDTATVASLYRDTVHATDPDGDALTFSFLASITGMTITDSIITFTPEQSNIGTHPVSVQVSDGYGGFDTLSWTVSVGDSGSVIPPGLVAYYPFSGNANDGSGYNNHGTVNGATLTDDRFGNSNSAYDFDGGDFITVTDASSINLQGSPVTFSAWVKTSNLIGLILYKYSYSEPHPGYGFSVGGQGKDGKINYWSSSYGYWVKSDSTVNDDAWHQLVVTVSNTTASFYLDGELNSSKTSSMPGNSTGIDLLIGAQHTIVHENNLDGVLDDIRIYNRALTSTEIDSLYHLGGWDTISITDSVADADGNVYHAITIGSQVWTIENLRTTQYNDTTPIPHVTDSAAWASLSTPGYCYYDNDSTSNAEKYGALYNWHAVNTGKLAPAGWHVSTHAEWDTLQNYLIANRFNWDGTTSGNKIAKAMTAKTDWDTSTTQGDPGNDIQSNNSSGFSALPGGSRFYDGDFYHPVGRYGDWWSATESVPSSSYNRGLLNSHDGLGRLANRKECGYSVRLVRD